MAGAPEPEEFLPAVLLDACDDSVELQLIMKRNEASLLNKIDDESKAKFMASAERARGEPLRQRVLNKARSTEKGLAAYVEWLARTGPLVARCARRLPRNLSRCSTPTSAASRSTTWSSRRRLSPKATARKAPSGVNAGRRPVRHGLAPAITSDWSIFVHNAGDGVDKVGEHLFYVDKRGKCCVALELQISTRERIEEAGGQPR